MKSCVLRVMITDHVFSEAYLYAYYFFHLLQYRKQIPPLLEFLSFW